MGSPFLKMAVNGQPSPAQMVKAETASDGDTHAHGQHGEHRHGPASYTDQEVAVLEAKGLHVDQVEGAVYSHDGTKETPLHIAAVLHEARQKATLKAATGLGNVGMAKLSGPNENAPVVRHIDLRHLGDPLG